jgi:hypothetical protein
MAGRSCVFCGGPPPLTREHVLPVWLQEYVGGDEPGHFRGTWANFLGMPMDERRASPNSHTLGTVCGECNNGWMSRLESGFKELLPRLERDLNPRRFTKAERAVLAKWIVKTGVVAHLSSNFRRILPEAFPESLAKGTVIPGGIKVFGGRTRPAKTIAWVQSNLASMLIRPSEMASLDTRNDSFIFALSIKGIFLGFAWHALDRNVSEIAIRSRSLHQYYPHPISAAGSQEFDDLQLAAMGVGLGPRGHGR